MCSISPQTAGGMPKQDTNHSAAARCCRSDMSEFIEVAETASICYSTAALMQANSRPRLQARTGMRLHEQSRPAGFGDGGRQQAAATAAGDGQSRHDSRDIAYAN